MVLAFESIRMTLLIDVKSQARICCHVRVFCIVPLGKKKMISSVFSCFSSNIHSQSRQGQLEMWWGWDKCKWKTSVFNHYWWQSKHIYIFVCFLGTLTWAFASSVFFFFVTSKQDKKPKLKIVKVWRVPKFFGKIRWMLTVWYLPAKLIIVKATLIAIIVMRV